jgi:ribosomal protein S18 acetylase RimI-like enzyme
MEDLKRFIDTEEFHTILQLIVYKPTPEKLGKVLDRYLNNSSMKAFGVREGCRITGMMGVKLIDETSAEITHIVVVPECRGQGIGRMLILGVVERLQLTKLMAETDKDAVNFYRCCGFSIRSLGEKYPGTERFECTLSR